MSAYTMASWYSDNQRYLMMALDEVKLYLQLNRPGSTGDVSGAVDSNLFKPEHYQEQYQEQHQEQHQERQQNKLAEIEKNQSMCAELSAGMREPPALESLCAIFGLSAFERHILLLCAGMELEGGFAAVCAAADSIYQRPYPTFGLALATLPAASWDAVTPTAPLRQWRLIEIGAGDTLMSSPLRIDERILHFLAGLDYLDERLKHFVQPIHSPYPLSPSQQALAKQLAELWSENGGAGNWPVVQLCGNEHLSKLAIVAAAGDSLVSTACILKDSDIPATTVDRQSLVLLWQREILLSRRALVLDCELSGSGVFPGTMSFIESIQGPLVVVRRDPFHNMKRSIIRFNVRKPDNAEQLMMWQQSLAPFANKLNGELENLVDHFSLGTSAIRAVSIEVLSDTSPGYSIKETGKRLWRACRDQARPGLDDLAQRIEPMAGWDDLVLPEPQKQILRQSVAHVRQRRRVYERWGFASKSRRGLGISALLAGASGTGKTMAAEVLAGELELDLYRIDLSSVVSKYIGETEKNLRRVFDAAEEGSAILLFDEADALFGKRSEVKDSHDRYANIEVSYLLQRMETYAGLSILTTNLKSALDTAFLRRIRFIVQFPFPDTAQRGEIWRRIYPAATPTHALEFDKLSRLNITGGNIRNIAMNAAFLAAEANEPVSMKHLLSATRSEYVKLEKPLTDNEISGWITQPTEKAEGVKPT